MSAGAMNEKNGIATLYDVLAAQGSTTTSATIYAVISSLESLLTGYKRVVVNDSAVNAVCYGAKLMLPDLLRHESGPASMSTRRSSSSPPRVRPLPSLSLRFLCLRVVEVGWQRPRTRWWLVEGLGK